jgi:hypothetical protein
MCPMGLHFMCTILFITVFYTRIILGKNFLVIALQIHHLLKEFLLVEDIYNGKGSWKRVRIHFYQKR